MFVVTIQSVSQGGESSESSVSKKKKGGHGFAQSPVAPRQSVLHTSPAIQATTTTTSATITTMF